MPSINSLDRLADTMHVLQTCAKALEAGELYPKQVIPCGQLLTEDSFYLTMAALKLTGVRVTSTCSNAGQYRPGPSARGYIGFFEILSRQKTIGYWLISEAEGWRFVRAQLKLTHQRH